MVTSVTIHPLTAGAWELRFASDGGGGTPLFRIYRDGVLLATTQRTRWTVHIEPDEFPVFEVLDQEDADPVNRYVTLLTARDTLDRLEREHPDFFGDYRKELKELREQLGRGDAVKNALPLERFDDRERFLHWFERMFFTDMTPAEGAK